MTMAMLFFPRCWGSKPEHHICRADDSYTGFIFFVEAKFCGVAQAGPKVCTYLILSSNFCGPLVLTSALWMLGTQAHATTFVFFCLYCPQLLPSLFLLGAKYQPPLMSHPPPQWSQGSIFLFKRLSTL